MKIAGYQFDTTRIAGHAMVLLSVRHRKGADPDSELRFKVAAALTKVKEVIIEQLKADVPAVRLLATVENGYLSFGFIDHTKTLEKETNVVSLGGESEHDPDSCNFCRLDRAYGAKPGKAVRPGGGGVQPGGVPKRDRPGDAGHQLD